MQSGSILSVIVFCTLITAGCVQLPGMHILSNTPEPIIGQWIGGELPTTDLHIIFYENGTFFFHGFYLDREAATDTGNWTKKDRGLYAAQSASGKVTEWTYDSFDDSMYVSGLPQRKYYRYRG
jgi:hypothetical protein